jgi:uncharacterized protein (DUF58 family)
MSCFTKTSSCFDHLARLQAARADADTLSTATYERANGLKVGIEAATGAVVGMTDAVAKLRPLATYIAALGHHAPPKEEFPYESKSRV